MLDLLARRPHSLDQLLRALHGADVDASQQRKLVATLATLLARKLVSRSGAGAFKLTQPGRLTLADVPPAVPSSARGAPRGAPVGKPEDGAAARANGRSAPSSGPRLTRSSTDVDPPGSSPPRARGL